VIGMGVVLQVIRMLSILGDCREED
jgi:hypothetical protein